MIGSGEDEDKIKNTIKYLGIENQAILMGYRSDIQNIMAQLDLVVLSSLYAFAYNSPAFEYPFIAMMLRGTADNIICKKLLDKQIELTISSDNKYFISNVNDPNTLKARAYELIRFLDLECD